MKYLIIIKIKDTDVYQQIECIGSSSFQSVLLALQYLLELPMYNSLEIVTLFDRFYNEFSTPLLARNPEEWASIKAEMHTYDDVYNINKIRPKDYLEMLNIINEMVGIKLK